MYFPIYTIPNFYSDPDKIINLANTFVYDQEATDGVGLRTKSLHNFNRDFFQYSNDKLLRFLYGPEHRCSYVAENIFCKIKDKQIKNKKGTIHYDGDTLLTVIIYLTPNLKNCGTNVYKRTPDYELIASSNGAFNTAFCFDGCFPHQALYDLKEGQERLTQALFFIKYIFSTRKKFR